MKLSLLFGKGKCIGVRVIRRSLQFAFIGIWYAIYRQKRKSTVRIKALSLKFVNRYEQFIEMICPRTTFHFQDSESFDAIMRGPLESDAEKAGDNMRLHQKIQILHQNMKMISYCFPGAKGVDTHLQRPPSLKGLCLCPWYRSYRSHEISGHRSCRNEVSCFEIQYGPVDARNTAQGPNLRLVYLEGSREVGTRTATREKKRVPRSKVRKDDNRLKAKKLKAGEGNRDNLFQNLCSLHSQPVRTFLNIFQEASKRARKEAQGGTLACGLIFSSIWYLGALQFYGPVPAKLLIEYGYDG